MNTIFEYNWQGINNWLTAKLYHSNRNIIVSMSFINVQMFNDFQYIYSPVPNNSPSPLINFWIFYRIPLFLIWITSPRPPAY